jgi:septum formation protein
MLRQAGLKCFAIPADLDEAAIKQGFTGPPGALALALAEAKAGMVAKAYPGALVIGADQLLVCEGRYFDKPEGLAEAAAHLRHLSGRTHRLVTATCVYRDGACAWSHIAEAHLTMRRLSEDFLTSYLAAEGQAICASVGAYRLEGLGSQLFERIEGDFFTILGLNLLPLLGFLRASGALAG